MVEHSKSKSTQPIAKPPAPPCSGRAKREICSGYYIGYNLAITDVHWFTHWLCCRLPQFLADPSPIPPPPDYFVEELLEDVAGNDEDDVQLEVSVIIVIMELGMSYSTLDVRCKFPRIQRQSYHPIKTLAF